MKQLVSSDCVMAQGDDQSTLRFARHRLEVLFNCSFDEQKKEALMSTTHSAGENGACVDEENICSCNVFFSRSTTEEKVTIKHFKARTNENFSFFFFSESTTQRVNTESNMSLHLLVVSGKVHHDPSLSLAQHITIEIKLHSPRGEWLIDICALMMQSAKLPDHYLPRSLSPKVRRVTIWQKCLWRKFY
jgi:hypothetical protein